MTLNDAIDKFLSDLYVDDDGCPKLDTSDSWSIVRSWRGDYYLAPVIEDFRDEVLFEASEIPDLHLYVEVSFDIDRDYEWLRAQVVEACEQ